MLELIATAAAIVAAAAGIGAFFDKYTSDATRDRLWENIVKADRRRWSAAAVNIVVIAYESVFTGRIGSIAFFRRSIFVYLGLLVAFTVFLAIFFPQLFVTSISPYVRPSFLGAASAVILTLSGSLLFWAANAQTLYFLRLAQLDPRPTPILLIFHADALLTASIAVFGLGALLWLYSLMYLNGGPHRVTLDLRLQPAEQTLREDLSRLRRYNADGEATLLSLHIQNQALRLKNATTVLTRNRPSTGALNLAKQDLDLAEDLLPLSGTPVQRISGEALQILDGNGEVTGFYSIDQALDVEWARTFESDITREQICQQISRPHLRGNRFVDLREVRFSGKWTISNCMDGKPGQISAEVSLNADNIAKMALFELNTNLVFQNVISSLTTGFRTYAAAHPLHYSRVDQSPTAWVHQHVISESDIAGLTRIDRALLKGYWAEEGVSTIVLNKTLPVGTMLSAIMATSLFTILLLSSAFTAIALASSAQLLSYLSSVFLIQKHPFVFVLLAAGLVAVLFRYTIL